MIRTKNVKPEQYTKYMIGLVVIVFLFSFVGFQFVWLRFNGSVVSIPDIPRNAQTFGSGDKIRYVVMGDSSAVGQGGDYDKGIAVKTAEYLAKNQEVSWINTAVSGARASDVYKKQLPKALVFKPNIVFISVGSNDVTHLTTIDSVRNSLELTVQELKKANCNVKILLTGSADMGSPPRIPQPLRLLAGVRAEKINDSVKQLVSKEEITFVPIAEKTGPQFRNDHSLFAPDNFHPNTKGYNLWTPVITEALDRAVKSQPSHCQ